MNYSNATLFIHIPRTGGTAFREALHIPQRDEEHLPAWEYRRRNPKAFYANTVVSLVRHPLDRLVSVCAWIHREKLSREDRDLEPSEFFAWIDSGLPEYDGRREPRLYQGTEYAANLYAPAQWWLCGEHDERPEDIIVDEILKFESVYGEFDPYGPKVNGSRRRPTACYLSPFVRDFVMNVYAWELEVFGYAV